VTGILYRIKPLEWKTLPGDQERVARTVFGNFIIATNQEGGWWIVNMPRPSVDPWPTNYKAAEDAQQECERHYRQRLTECLVMYMDAIPASDHQ